MENVVALAILSTYLSHEFADCVAHAEQLRRLVEHVGGELPGELHLAHEVPPPDERPQLLNVLHLLLGATLDDHLKESS